MVRQVVEGEAEGLIILKSFKNAENNGPRIVVLSLSAHVFFTAYLDAEGPVE